MKKYTLRSENISNVRTETENITENITETENINNSEFDSEKKYDANAKTGKVINVNIYDETLIKITCEYLIIKIIAMADCCSESWFEFPYGNIKNIIGDQIINITTEKTIDMPFSNRQEVDINTIIKIHLKKNNTFDLVLRNSSNGYYNGWIDVDYVSPFQEYNNY